MEVNSQSTLLMVSRRFIFFEVFEEKCFQSLRVPVELFVPTVILFLYFSISLLFSGTTCNSTVSNGITLFFLGEAMNRCGTI